MLLEMRLLLVRLLPEGPFFSVACLASARHIIFVPRDLLVPRLAGPLGLIDATASRRDRSLKWG